MTFSTLCSGRVFATRTKSHVSISCVTFSTLCSGRVFATSSQECDCVVKSAFSTLCSGRVFATQPTNTIYHRRQNFQYPVFGSSVCNRRWGWGGGLRIRLSVPCVRVECLQQRRQPAGEHRPPAFSTLCSGRVFATRFLPPCLVCLSNFQYPVFGSSVCNTAARSAAATGCGSFSTLCSGRVFATFNAPALHGSHETFSTLCSGRVFATRQCQRASTNYTSFSTLCSGRVFATSLS